MGDGEEGGGGRDGGHAQILRQGTQPDSLVRLEG